MTDYDLIITHYGLTSFEALYAGVPVLLASPTGYHEKLAKHAGFLTLGIGKRNAERKLRFLLKKGEAFSLYLNNLKSLCAELAIKFNLDREPKQSLADLVNSFTPDVSRSCPVCGAELFGPVLARFPERGFLRCKRCGAIIMNRIKPAPIEYGREYFFEQYQKQYGKTYIDDFPNLTAMAKRRLAVIRKIGSREWGVGSREWGVGSGEKIGNRESGVGNRKIGTTEKEREGQNKASSNSPHSLLDIGCAYGAFLSAAREEGFSPQGIDPAEDAVRYVTQTIGIPAIQGYFPAPQGGKAALPLPLPNFDVITLWYVIEHFRDCVPALAEIKKLLKPGGALAFATPSFTGVSGRGSLKRFLEHSPQDHWTIWSPSVCGKALKKAGFKAIKIVNSGHHPERFPLMGKFAHNKNSLLYRLLLAVSRIFALGDTFEVYAVMKD
jgi:2-polyprenyl-3-methyl-5-hydroxy-6-metoxy-1,4-benzoquinol methylase